MPENWTTEQGLFVAIFTVINDRNLSVVVFKAQIPIILNYKHTRWRNIHDLMFYFRQYGFPGKGELLALKSSTKRIYEASSLINLRNTNVIFSSHVGVSFKINVHTQTRTHARTHAHHLSPVIAAVSEAFSLLYNRIPECESLFPCKHLTYMVMATLWTIPLLIANLNGSCS